MADRKQKKSHAEKRSRGEKEGGHSFQQGGLENPPSDWHVACVGDLTLRTQQRNPARDPDKIFRYVDVSSVSNTSFRITEPTEVPGAQAPSRARKVIRAGDVLFATVRPTLKRVALVSEEFDDQIASTGFVVLRADSKHLDSSYLYFRLLTDEFIARMRELERGASYPAVRDSDILNEEIPIPPFAEQRKIAGVLGLVQQAMEQQERLIALTTELKKTLLHQLFTQGLRGEPQKQTEIGPVPQSWEITELGKVVNFFCGFAFKSEEGVKTSNTQLVRMGNLYKNKLDLTRSPIFYPDEFAQKYSRFVLKVGDLIMSLTGTSGKEDYGFTVELKVFPKTLLLNQRIARIDLISEKLTKDFLFYFLLSRKFLDLLYPTAKGMKQANLSTHAMKRLKVPMPGVDEQKEIASHFRKVSRKIELDQARLDSLRDLFRTLLHQLMTGQIRVSQIDMKDNLGIEDI